MHWITSSCCQQSFTFHFIVLLDLLWTKTCFLKLLGEHLLILCKFRPTKYFHIYFSVYPAVCPRFIRPPNSPKGARQKLPPISDNLNMSRSYHQYLISYICPGVTTNILYLIAVQELPPISDIL